MASQQEANDVFAAIAAPARRAILAQLAQREMPVLEIADSFEMTLSAVSQHLGVLRSANLVAIRKEGKQRFYRLNGEPLKAVAEWANAYEKFWSGKLAALGEYLDATSEEDPNTRAIP